MAVLRFSVFELDGASGELTRSGRRLPVAPQPFKVLWRLADRAGHVVSRQELRELLWGTETHVEFERALNFSVAAARRALGDDARRPRFIETLPQRGYRFIADVHRVDSPPDAPPAPFDSRRGPAPWRRWAWAALVPLLVAQQPLITVAHTRATAAREAVAAFLRGESLVQDGIDGRRRSLHDFETAVRLDGRFAEAHYALATTYLDLAQARVLPWPDALPRARAAASRALRLEEVSESRRLLGTLRLIEDWDWAAAGRELARAVALSPGGDGPLVAYAEYLSAAAEDAAALVAIEQAEHLSPACDLLFYRSAWVHYRARHYDAALARLDEARRLGPPRDRTAADWLMQLHSLALFIHIEQARWAAAQAEAAAIIRLRQVPGGHRGPLRRGRPA